MKIKNIILLFFLVLIINISQLYSQDQAQSDEKKYSRIENFLYEYYTKDLQITDVAVKIDKEITAISGTPDFRDREKAIGQIVLAISGAGTAAPWTREICFTVQIQGMPLGYIEVPTKKAMLASEGKISPEAFISSFITTQLPIPIDFPRDLLMPIINSDEIWEDASIIECNADKIEEILNVNAENFLPEFLHAAYVKADPADGSPVCIAAVIDFENTDEAKDFNILNKTEPQNKKIHRIGSIVYIIKGTERMVNKGIASLKPKLKPKKKGSDAGIVKEESIHKKKFFIIGAGLFILLLIVLFIFIISGRKSGNIP